MTKYISFQNFGDVSSFECLICHETFDFYTHQQPDTNILETFLDDHIIENHAHVCYKCNTCYRVLTNKTKLVKEVHNCDYSRIILPTTLNDYMCKDVTRIVLDYLYFGLMVRSPLHVSKIVQLLTDEKWT